jgi:hypothetical protein
LTANRDVPALIACTTRQQAHDLHVFSKQHKPSGRPIPGMVLGETPEKERKDSDQWTREDTHKIHPG